MHKLLKKLKIIMLILVLLLSCLFSFTGCTSITNIDDLGYVVAIGLDPGSDGNNIKLSVQISIPTSSEQGSDSPTSAINSIECSSIDSGINLINTFVSKKLNLSHCKVVVISEQLAYNGIDEYLYTLINDIELRPDTSIVISKCTAEYYLDNSKPILEKLPARYYEISLNSSEYTAYTENVTIREFFYAITDTVSNAYAILRRGK